VTEKSHVVISLLDHTKAEVLLLLGTGEEEEETLEERDKQE
jgi:hypothetical protein